MIRHLSALLFASALFVSACGARGQGAGPKGNQFDLVKNGRHVKVWYHRPAGLSADAPIVIVMHGVGRDADRYLSEWVPLADANHFLVVAPEFSQTEFPGEDGYIYGNTVDLAGNPLPREQWSFSFIEPVFDAIRARTGNRSSTYRIYGHSAGAQFVQRFLYFVPAARVSRAVCANAGWYMLPDLAAAFPYGLRGTPVTEADLGKAFGRPLLVLLGTADTDPKAKELRKTPEAEAQGPDRLARGQYFFNQARRAAELTGTPFRWSLAFAPGIAHSDAGVAPYAIQWLLQN